MVSWIQLTLLLSRFNLFRWYKLPKLLRWICLIWFWARSKVKSCVKGDNKCFRRMVILFLLNRINDTLWKWQFISSPFNLLEPLGQDFVRIKPVEEIKLCDRSTIATCSKLNHAALEMYCIWLWHKLIFFRLIIFGWNISTFIFLSLFHPRSSISSLGITVRKNWSIELILFLLKSRTQVEINPSKLAEFKWVSWLPTETKMQAYIVSTPQQQ